MSTQDPLASKHDRDLAPVYAATYDHIGIILWGLEKLEASLDKEFDWLERHPDFCIGWDHEAYAYDYLAEHAPQVLDKMRAALARFPGRLGVGSCTYGQPLSMFVNGESNVRQLTMAMDATEGRLGYPLAVYIMSEHPFHAQMPQLLAGCGFKGAILRTHFMMYGHNPEFEAPVGWWIGVDGSRLPALPTYPGQLVSPLFTDRIPGLTSTLDNRILTDAISERCQMTLADFRRQFGGRIRPLVATRADDVRNEESLILAHQGDPDYRWILVEDLFSLLPQPRAEFRTQANDFLVRMPWGYCGHWMWNRCRQAEVRVLTAERLAAIGHALGGPHYEAELASAWKNLLVAQHHDIQICGLEQEARHFLGHSLASSDRAIEKAMQAIAPRIGREGQGPRQVVFNPLPWARREWLSMAVEAAEGTEGCVISVPGLGFTTLEGRIERGKADAPAFEWQPDAQSGAAQAGCLLTPWYEVYTAPTGGFRLICDRETGRPLLAPPVNSGTLAGLVNGCDRGSVGEIVDLRLGGDRALLIEEGQVGGIPYRCEWAFYRHARRIDWHGELEFEGQWIGRPKVPVGEGGRPFPTPEERDRGATVTAFNDHEFKLRLRFYPYLGPRAVGVRDLPFHIAETPDPYVQGVYWTAVADGSSGLALFNRGLMGSVWEKDGAFSSVLAFSLPYVWGTRWLNGRYTYDLGILPFVGDWRQADLHRQALEYNYPCVAYTTSRWEKPLGETWTPYRETGDGKAILSALYTREGRTYARFYEHRGESAEVALEWMGQPAQLVAVDLRERERCRLGRRAALGPWQIQTLAIESDRIGSER